MCLEDKLFEDFLSLLMNDKKIDIEKIRAAYQRAKSCHEGQLRSSGEAYVCHPIEVAKLVYEFGLDTDSICAAFLHDTIEDTDLTFEDVKKEFGLDCANLVDGVTKLGQIQYTTKEEAQVEYLRKMFLAMAKDIRVIMIKLADRLHNVRTLGARPREKQLNTAHETLEIYAPLAHRLGMQRVKQEMEDISVSYLDPDGCKMIHDRLKEFEVNGHDFVEKTKKNICEKLKAYDIPFDLTYRVKHTFSIYRKLFTQNKTFEELYDIYAFRLIVNTVNDCYYLLGVIHDLYNPIPGRFKDYISTPKPNMYQSLHTTVVSKEKIAFEVQIRTWDMHYTAEYGIAAHWKYKAGIQKKDKLEERLAWVRQFIENQQDVDDAEDIVQSIKTDLDIEDVFVFTPKGDVITLPEGSTPIDFAYSIHTAVGNRMVGAKVNGRIVPLDYKLKTGEIVEVLTTSAAGHGPSRDWLNIVHTGEARNKIRSWFKKERREENIQQGKADLERELSRNLIRLPEDRMEQFLMNQAKKQHCASLDDFYAAIGYGGVMLSRLIPRIKDEYNRMQKEEQLAAAPIKPMVVPPQRRNMGGVIIDELDDCLVKFAQCCNPVPGDSIIGFITRGYGVSIHRRDCSNVPTDIENAPNKERWISVKWEQSVDTVFNANLRIQASEQVDLLLKIATTLSNLHIPVHSINARDQEVGAVVTMTIAVNSVEHLQYVIQKLCAIPGVDDVQRTGI